MWGRGRPYAVVIALMGLLLDGRRASSSDFVQEGRGEMEGAVGVAVEERFKTGSLFIGGGVWERGEAARGFQDFESLASSSDRGCKGEKGSVVGGFGEEGVLLEVDVGKVVVEAIEGVT